MYCKECGNKIENNNELCARCNPENKNEKKDSLYTALFYGRIGRIDYFLYLVLLSAILMLALAVIQAIFGLEAMLKSTGLLAFVSIAYIPLMAKRFRDIGLPGKASIFLYVAGLVSKSIPILMSINILLGLILLFKKGDLAVNKYGLPASRSKHTKLIIGSIVISFVLLSILFSV